MTLLWLLKMVFVQFAIDHLVRICLCGLSLTTIMLLDRREDFCIVHAIRLLDSFLILLPFFDAPRNI